MTGSAAAREVLDVVPWCTEIAGESVTLLLTGESIAVDTKAQRDQEALLLAFVKTGDVPSA